MIEYINKISHVENAKRFNGIIQILEDNELPYEIVHQKQGEHWIKNIIIPLNRNNYDKRFVLSAHYDSFAGSCGANDNASGVSVLIELACKMKQRKLTKCYDIAFFDREEYGDKGSEQYIEYLGKQNIIGVINFDTCGYGNRILLGPTKNLEDSVFNFVSKECIKKHNIKIIERTPGSDDRSFEQYQIPNLSLCVVPETDVSIISKIIDYEMDGKGIPEDEKLIPPEFMRTVHSGDMDKISVVKEESLEMVLNFTYDLIRLHN